MRCRVRTPRYLTRPVLARATMTHHQKLTMDSPKKDIFEEYEFHFNCHHSLLRCSAKLQKETNDENEKLRLENEQLQKSNKQLQEEVATMQMFKDMLAERNAKFELLEQSKRDAETKVEALTARVESLKADFSDIQFKITNERIEHKEKLDRDLDFYNHVCTKYKNEIAQLNGKNALFQEKLAEAREERHHEAERARTFELEVQTLKQELARSQAELARAPAPAPAPAPARPPLRTSLAVVLRPARFVLIGRPIG